MRPGLGFPYPEEAGLAPLWAAGVAPEGKDEKTAQRRRLGIYCRPAGKTKWESWLRAIASMSLSVRLSMLRAREALYCEGKSIVAAATAAGLKSCDHP
jgi:hypothetical protein